MLELATTPPETMLGDTAVAINAEDPRYKHLHGCHVVLPLLNREIPHRLRRARRHGEGHRRCEDHPRPRPPTTLRSASATTCR